MLSMPTWSAVHQFMVKHKEYFLALFTMSNISVIFLGLVAWFTFSFAQDDYGKMIGVGAAMGNVALIFYCLTLLPGIAKRFGVLPLQRATLMLYRRQFGVLMFLTAYVHGAIISTIPLAMTVGLRPEFFGAHEQVGQLAILVLFPLWLTSNDTSVRVLKQKWQWLHRITYLALFLIFLHVVLVSALPWALLAGTVLLLEIASWIKEFRRKSEIRKNSAVKTAAN